MSSPKGGSTRKRRTTKGDDDWKPESSPEVVKKARKPRNSPIISSDPYNHRHHDPDIARLGVAVEGSIRHTFLSQVALSTKVITWMHSKLRSPIIDLYFIIMSNLGDQVLYICLLPWFLWVIDPPFGRMFLLLLVTGTTFGNALKNVFSLPRPPSPPLWAPHKHEDFGMPSTHTLNAVSMSLFFAFWLWPSIHSDGGHYLLILFVLWYTCSMFVSRMYLAAHSHLDTISGLLLGILYFVFWVYVHKPFDHFLNTNPYAPLYVGVGVALLLMFHPRSSRPSPSFRYSMSLSGLALGVSIGVHISRFIGSSFWLTPIQALFSFEFRDSVLNSIPPDWHKLAAEGLGIVVGILILMIIYLLVKFSALIVLLVLFRAPPVSWAVRRFKVFLRYIALPHPIALDNLDHPQWHEDREVVNPRDAKMMGDMISTVCVGIIITHFIPVILNKMGFLLTSLLSK